MLQNEGLHEVEVLTTATPVVVPLARACDNVRHCCSFISVIGVSHSREPLTFRHVHRLSLRTHSNSRCSARTTR